MCQSRRPTNERHQTIEPVLVEGLDQVLLIRLYPEAEALSAAGDMALAQGAETAAAGAVLESSQYEPRWKSMHRRGAAPTGTHRTAGQRRCAARTAGWQRTSCTMGNWEGMQAEPHSYAYQWQLDGANITGRHGNAANRGGRRRQDGNVCGDRHQCAGDHRSATSATAWW